MKLSYVLLTSGNLSLSRAAIWVEWFGEMVKELQIPQSLFWRSVFISLRSCVAWDKHRESEKKLFASYVVLTLENSFSLVIYFS